MFINFPAKGHSAGFWMWRLTHLKFNCTIGIANVYVCQWAHPKSQSPSSTYTHTHSHAWHMTWTWIDTAFNLILGCWSGRSECWITGYHRSISKCDPNGPMLSAASKGESLHWRQRWTRASFHEDVEERERWGMCIPGTSSWGHTWKNISGKDVTWQNEVGMEKWCHSTCHVAWNLECYGKLAWCFLNCASTDHCVSFFHCDQFQMDSLPKDPKSIDHRNGYCGYLREGTAHDVS